MTCGHKKTNFRVQSTPVQNAFQEPDRFQSIRDEIEQQLEEARRQSNAMFERQLGAMEARQRRYEASLSNLGTEVRQIEGNCSGIK